MMEQEIINKYLNGESIAQLLREYPKFNRRQITKLLQNNNVSIRGGRKKREFSEEQIQEIREKINNNIFLKELAQEYKTSEETMRNLLQQNNLQIKSRNRVNRRIQSNYFSNIDSPIKAYWLGFLFTDGSVDHYGKTGRIRLQLQEADKEILEKFKEDLSLDCKIIYDRRANSTCCSVEFTDEQIYNDLQKYSIIPNKTYNIDRIPYNKIPEEYLNAYALGLFDGDGGLSYSKDFSSDVTFGYTAYHESEVADFQDLINKLINKEQKNKNFFTSAWHTQWRGRLQVLSILDVLYSNCPRFLKRKHDKYLALKNSLN